LGVYAYAKRMTDAATIFALSSAPGRAGISVIRISGPHVKAVLEAMAAPASKPRYAALRTVRHPASGEALDRGVVLWFAAPSSETGEDVAEFQLHGSRAVVAAVLSALASLPGLRLAEPGEFARRAFDNGKLDLAEVEGLADLIDAETDAQRAQALAQASGTLSRLYDGWRARLIEIAALTEAAIDFSDESDVAVDAMTMARARAADLATELAAHLDDGHRGEILRDGFRVALLGAPNAGKSSLLNALARRDAAIVSAEAGTTRDVIEVRLDLAGLPVIISDTAGIREAAGEVEQEGIRRSLAVARDADLVLWLAETAGSGLPPGIARDKSLLIRSKADIPGSGFGDLGVSSRTGAGLDRLVDEIAGRARKAVGAPAAEPALTRTRHRQALERALADIHAFLEGPASEPELRAEDLRRAAYAVGRITGRIDVEDVLGEIFGRFCIGK
jgi:tRNA modification GTPase